MTEEADGAPADGTLADDEAAGDAESEEGGRLRRWTHRLLDVVEFALDLF